MSNEKKSEIRFEISLNDDKVPEHIQWMATDSQNKEMRQAESMMIYLWDPKESNTLSINLWTPAMKVDEMHVHFYQTLMTMADTFEKATGNKFAVNDMRQFCESLDKKVKAAASAAEAEEK